MFLIWKDYHFILEFDFYFAFLFVFYNYYFKFLLFYECFFSKYFFYHLLFLFYLQIKQADLFISHRVGTLPCHPSHKTPVRPAPNLIFSPCNLALIDTDERDRDDDQVFESCK